MYQQEARQVRAGGRGQIGLEEGRRTASAVTETELPAMLRTRAGTAPSGARASLSVP